MGDLRASSPEPTASAVPEERPSSSSSSSVSSSAIPAEYWQRAEAATLGIIAQVQPTPLSEDRRNAVIDYVQRLIRNSVGCEVFPFGSVPLKTYLPDGDIDLTAFGGMNVEEALANDVFSVLEKEDQNKTAEFVVKDVQLIRAEVKLVKCLVQNIVVDISFNQLGGLCTLCFLEKVDRLIGKNHLFKRSIILIKSWCYYESRILGAHHGLISTYALETLVLYIFHLFHSTLHGPLAVLYKFLNYFSKFEWDTYCISLNGPVRISSLPDFVVEPPENGGCDLLLSSEFIKECLEMFSAPSRGFETNSRTFQPKHLNIVDPLKENNNLGRSVSKGNFYRIRSAFTYGARKLGRILSQPEENVADELHKFFTNTLDRHGSGQRPDVQDAFPMDGQYGAYGLSPEVHFSGREPYQEDETTCESDSTDSNGGFSVKVSRRGVCLSQSSRSGDESQSSANGFVVSEKRLVGDAKDLATSRAQGLSISNAEFKASSRSVGSSLSPVAKPFHAPHLYFSHPVRANGEMGDGNPGEQRTENGGFSLKRISSGIVPTHSEDTTNLEYTDPDDNQFIGNHEVLYPAGLTNHPWCSADHFLGHSGNHGSSGAPVNLKVFNPLSDLSGDYVSHLSSLHHGRRWFEYASNVSFSPMSPPLLPQFRSKTSWDVVRQTYRRNAISQGNVNGVAPRPVFYPMNPPLIPGAPFGMEELPKPRGTGTYFPNANHYRDRSLTAKGRNQAPLRSPRNNPRLVTSQETTFPDRDGHETSQAQFHVNQGGGKSGSSDPRSPGTPDGEVYSKANGVTHLPESVVEFGSIGHLSLATPLVDNGGRQSNPASPTALSSGISPTATGMQRPKSVLTMDQDRIAMEMQSFRLKDEDDFPPLSDSSGKGVPIYVAKKVERDEQ